MRASRVIAVLLTIGAIAVTASTVALFRNLTPVMDLQYRYNELLCSHERTNPFHVWNGDVVSERFKGLPRPDIPKDVNPNKLTVHAYPPWHTTYTWFWGGMDWSYVVGCLFFLYGMCLFALFTNFRNMVSCGSGWFYWSWISLMLVPHCVACMAAGNYGIVCAGLLLAMIALLERDHQLLAGIAWGLMMVKPQIATLMFFPLLFQKKYLTIVVAVAMCLVATLWPSYIYGESPIALVLQIPQIGAPYETNGALARFLPTSVAALVKICWIVFCVLLCGWLSWKWRNAEKPLFRFVPVAFIFPYWLYSQAHDRVASWPFVVAMALLLPMIVAKNRRYSIFVTLYLFIWGIKNIVCGAWRFCTETGITLPSWTRTVYGAFNYPVAIAHFAVCMFVLFYGFKLIDGTDGEKRQKG